MMKKLLAVLLTTLLLMTACAWAEEAEPTVYTSGDWKYVLLEDGSAEIVDYNGKATRLTVPAEIDGIAVTSIGDRAFDYSSPTSITLPDSITAIGDKVFYCCSSLTSITLPKFLASIGDEAFSYCSSLTIIALPESLTFLGKDTFKDCTLTLAIPRDSWLEQWCKENGLRYTYPDSLDWLLD